MTTIPTDSGHPSALHRVNRGTITLTALAVVLSLVVLLQLLPGADAAAVQWAAGTELLFVGWAVLTLSVIGAFLVRATRRERD